MNAARSRRSTPSKITVALLLTVAAGQVDVVGFLSFLGVFTAHMTGNTVHLAMSLVHGHGVNAAKAGLMIPLFVAGSVVGRCAIEFGARHRWRRAASFVCLLEAAAVSEVIWLNRSHPAASTAWISLFLLAFGMGLQTATLTRIGPLTIHTTFVTGMLNSLGQRLSNVLFWIVDRMAGKRGLPLSGLWNSRAFRESVLLTAVWIAYLFGGICGALLVPRWATGSLFLTLAILFAAILIDQVSMLSIEEEEEAQPERFLREEPKPGSI